MLIQATPSVNNLTTPAIRLILHPNPIVNVATIIAMRVIVFVQIETFNTLKVAINEHLREQGNEHYQSHWSYQSY